MGWAAGTGPERWTGERLRGRMQGPGAGVWERPWGSGTGRGGLGPGAGVWDRPGGLGPRLGPVVGPGESCGARLGAARGVWGQAEAQAAVGMGRGTRVWVGGPSRGQRTQPWGLAPPVQALRPGRGQAGPGQGTEGAGERPWAGDWALGWGRGWGQRGGVPGQAWGSCVGWDSQGSSRAAGSAACPPQGLRAGVLGGTKVQEGAWGSGGRPWRGRLPALRGADVPPGMETPPWQQAGPAPAARHEEQLRVWKEIGTAACKPPWQETGGADGWALGVPPPSRLATASRPCVGFREAPGNRTQGTLARSGALPGPGSSFGLSVPPGIAAGASHGHPVPVAEVPSLCPVPAWQRAIK